MAHTLNGNLTGRAASTYRREIRQEIEDAQNKKIHEAWLQKEDEAIRACIAIEGPDAFMVWYKDDNTVPPYGSIIKRVELLRTHWQELKADARYTMVDKLVGEECANIQKIADTADSINWEEA
jgi:hypothetical protein